MRATTRLSRYLRLRGRLATKTSGSWCSKNGHQRKAYSSTAPRLCARHPSLHLRFGRAAYNARRHDSPARLEGGACAIRDDTLVWEAEHTDAYPNAELAAQPDTPAKRSTVAEPASCCDARGEACCLGASAYRASNVTRH